MMRIFAVYLLALVLSISFGCEEQEAAIVVTLVPNPEVNTRANVSEHLNKIEFVLDSQTGFAGLEGFDGESWGPFEVIDVDGDEVLELLLTRRGSEAFESFALLQGRQDDRLISITARGYSTHEDQLTALGGASSAFENDGETDIEVPFNLLPEYRPLRVLSMRPPVGAQDIPPPDEVVLQLGGEVLTTALDGQVTILNGGEITTPTVVVSYVDTSMGRLTNVRLHEFELADGPTLVTLETEICTTTGQCLDQHLNIDSAQPFEGGFTVSNHVMVEENPHETEVCDPTLCEPPLFVCDVDNDACVADCRIYNACPNLTHTCDENTGLCS